MRPIVGLSLSLPPPPLSTHVTLTLVKPGAAAVMRGCHLDLPGLRRSLQPRAGSSGVLEYLHANFGSSPTPEEMSPHLPHDAAALLQHRLSRSQFRALTAASRRPSGVSGEVLCSVNCICTAVSGVQL